MALSAVLLLLASPLLAPQLLAFPHKTETPIGTVWSEEELDPDMLSLTVEHTQERLRTSPLAEANEQRWVFITDGGWRWKYVANISSSAFAITRPLSPAVIVNRTDPNSGVIRNGRELGGERELGGLLAHEFAHELIRRNYGRLASTRFPTWKVEGYCDYVAGESTLTEAQVARLKDDNEDHPALIYFEGRKRVEAILKANGGSVDALFEEG
ncbi:hypothetical protein [uncultured Erythrobacter sp.]|uniref:hypothetical protein n=1 Tax=uncultured Erythrobacter sp. TaxID=263913 RepID=UPI0026086DF8|nr:hypothetical protein [uncultured Erythrobacter sp.]